MSIIKTCKISGQKFTITDQDLKFYEKLWVPTPTLCPEERARRRYSWRNEKKLYWRKCDATGKRILSIFSPNKPFTVYEKSYWYSDKWNPLDYGMDFDFTKPFFQQFRELMEKVPMVALSNWWHSENSDYCNQGDELKNCYLVFEGNNNQSCYYCSEISNSSLCVDSSAIQKSEKLYECLNCENCFDSKYLQNSKNCIKSWFLKNCINCEECFWSANLQGKKYYFFNEKYSKEEYYQKINSLKLEKYSSIQEIKKKVSKFFLKFPNKYINWNNNENSTWDYLNNTQNCKNCYNVQDSQNCKNIFYGYWLNNVHDMTVYWDWWVEYCYENHEIGQNIRNICFSDQVWEWCYNIFYSKMCIRNSHDLFWCIWFRNKNYCILNKQYTKEEYLELRWKIIEHMKQTWEYWEFFPSSISPFGYNETVAQQYFPLTKEQAKSKWFNWSNYESPSPKVEKIIPVNKLPENIKDIPDDILNWAIMPEKTENNENTVGTADLLSLQPEIQKPFRIIKQELEFYRKHNLPIPRKHPDQRHLERMVLRNPRKLFDRKCDKCWVDMKTTYSPDRTEIVYCEKCYNEEVY